jgi:hypothetical protein
MSAAPELVESSVKRIDGMSRATVSDCVIADFNNFGRFMAKNRSVA